MTKTIQALITPSLLISMLFPIYLFAQSLDISPSSLDFGDTNEGSPDSILFTISNPSVSDTVSLLGIKFYQTYSKTDFSASPDQFLLLPGASEDIWVKFAPRHNITYNSEMVILDDGKRGSMAVNLTGNGRYEAYYSQTFNKSEQVLKAEITTLLAQGFSQKSYNAARDRMFMFIHNEKVNGQGAAQNTLECVYTGREIMGYTSRTDAQFNFPIMFNTEHTWPQSFFSSALPMRSDLHHIFPTWDRSNSERANHPFGEITGTADWQDGGSMRKGSLFEPRDLHKGGVARAMLYFVLRYQNYSNFLNSQESILRQWNETFAPSAIEKRRNDDVHAFQGNRNPFTDYPQLTERITSFSTTSAAADRLVLDRPESQIDYGTVPANQDIAYQYVFVNDGNQDIELKSLSLSDAKLKFDTGTGADVTLAPGESHSVVVLLNAPGGTSLSATLDLTTNVPGEPALSIPIIANVVSGVSIDPSKGYAPPIFWPNPAKNTLQIEWAGTRQNLIHTQIVDIMGHKVLNKNLKVVYGKASLDLPELTPGVYLITVKDGKRNWQDKIIIE